MAKKAPEIVVKERFMCPLAVHLILEEQGKLLLMRRFQTGYQDGMYALVGGCVEEGESIVDAMAREAKEEAGIEIKKEDLSIEVVIYRRREGPHKDAVHFFLKAAKYQGAIANIEPDQCDEIGWYTKLPENTIDHIKRALKAYNEGIRFLELGRDVT